jgi:hypothetical protein
MLLLIQAKELQIKILYNFIYNIQNYLIIFKLLKNQVQLVKYFNFIIKYHQFLKSFFLFKV